MLILASSVGVAAEPPEYVVEGDAIPAPLATLAADPAEGRRLFADRAGGHYVLCHQVADLEVPFQGNLGPALDDVGERLSAGQIRLRIADASRVNPATVMPAYYRTQGLEQVAAEYRGQTVLSAREVEHLVAWLATLNRENIDALP